MCLYFLCVCMWKVCCYTPRAIIRRLRTTCTRIESVGGELLLFYLCVCIFFDFFFFRVFYFTPLKTNKNTTIPRNRIVIPKKKKPDSFGLYVVLPCPFRTRLRTRKSDMKSAFYRFGFFFFLFFVTSTRITNGVWKMVFFFCCYFRRVKLRFTRKSGSHFFFSTKLVRI